MSDSDSDDIPDLFPPSPRDESAETIYSRIEGAFPFSSLPRWTSRRFSVGVDGRPIGVTVLGDPRGATEEESRTDLEAFRDVILPVLSLDPAPEGAPLPRPSWRPRADMAQEEKAKLQSALLRIEELEAEVIKQKELVKKWQDRALAVVYDPDGPFAGKVREVYSAPAEKWPELEPELNEMTYE